jgi:hypothetical protein
MLDERDQVRNARRFVADASLTAHATHVDKGYVDALEGGETPRNDRTCRWLSRTMRMTDLVRTCCSSPATSTVRYVRSR